VGFKHNIVLHLVVQLQVQLAVPLELVPLQEVLVEAAAAAATLEAMAVLEEILMELRQVEETLDLPMEGPVV
jgi:hypothetical protein